MNAMKTSLVATGVVLAGLMFGPGVEKAQAQCWGGPVYYGGYYAPPVVVAPAPVIAAPAPVFCAPSYPVYTYPRYYRSYGFRGYGRAYPRVYGGRGFNFGFGINY